MAARIDYDRAGLLGRRGDKRVVLFKARGLSSDVVFSGGPVEISRLHWKSDSELEISFGGNIYSCTSMPPVKVRCVPR
jgi:hypothetical protein